MARPVVRWATRVVGCRMGVAYTPIHLEMMCFPWGDMAMSTCSGCPVTTYCHARPKQKEIKNQEKDAQPEKTEQKIVFSDLRTPLENFTPLFREVAKFRTLTKKEEQYNRNGEKAERYLPQNT